MVSTEKPLMTGSAQRDIKESINVDEVLEKYDPESRFLKLSGLWLPIAKTIAILFSLFQLYTGLFGVFEAQIQRPTHLMFTLALVYFLYPYKPKRGGTRPHSVDIVLSTLSVTATLYSIMNYETLMESAGLYSNLDVAVALLGIILTLEATRRIVGLPIVIIAASFLAYAYLGALFSRVSKSSWLRHPAHRFPNVVYHRRDHRLALGCFGQLHLSFHSVWSLS